MIEIWRFNPSLNSKITNIKQIREKIDDLQKWKERLLDLYFKTEIDRKEFLEKRHLINKELSTQEAIYKRHEKGDKNFENKITDLVEVFLYLPEEFAKARIERKVKILKKMVSKVTITTEKQIIFEMLPPYDLFITPEIQGINKLENEDELLSHPQIRAVDAAIRTMPAA